MRHCRAHPAANRDPAARPVPRETCWSTAGPALPARRAPTTPATHPGPSEQSRAGPRCGPCSPQGPGTAGSGTRRPRSGAYPDAAAMFPPRAPLSCDGGAGPGRCRAVRRRLSDLSAWSPRWGGERLPGRRVTAAVPRGTAGSGTLRPLPSPARSSRQALRRGPRQAWAARERGTRCS